MTFLLYESSTDSLKGTKSKQARWGSRPTEYGSPLLGFAHPPPNREIWGRTSIESWWIRLKESACGLTKPRAAG